MGFGCGEEGGRGRDDCIRSEVGWDVTFWGYPAGYPKLGAGGGVVARGACLPPAQCTCNFLSHIGGEQGWGLRGRGEDPKTAPSDRCEALIGK